MITTITNENKNKMKYDSGVLSTINIEASLVLDYLIFAKLRIFLCFVLFCFVYVNNIYYLNYFQQLYWQH